jgi:hypothetical protein
MKVLTLFSNRECTRMHANARESARLVGRMLGSMISKASSFTSDECVIHDEPAVPDRDPTNTDPLIY